MKSLTRSGETDGGGSGRFGMNNEELEWRVSRRDWNDKMV